MAQLLRNLPIGARIKFGAYAGKPLTWLLASDNCTLITEYIINDRMFDAAESLWTEGSAQYSTSNIRQWLNSDAQVWYSPAHGSDEPPLYENAPGFLNSFTSDEKNALQTVTVTTRHLSGGGYATYTTTDKVFVPSVQDVTTGTYPYTESTLLPLFSDSSYLITQVIGGGYTSWWTRSTRLDTASFVFAISNQGAISDAYPYSRIGVRPCIKLSSAIKVTDITDSSGYYTLVYNTAPPAPIVLNVPTIYGGKSNSISWGSVNDPDGDVVTYTLECSVNGGAYAQIYSGTSTVYAHLVPFGTTSVQYRVKASDTSGESSAYTTSTSRTVVNNNAPVIDGTDSNLGVKSAGFTGTYKVTDANNNTVTVTESIDGVQIRSLVVTLGATNTYGITGNTWLALPNGSHTLTIRATDGIDSSVRTYTFAKLVNSFTIRNATPWASATMPTRIMLVVTRNIPEGATFKVEVCNNGFDTNPTWEDATDAVRSGLVHVFANKAKTAGQWGVLIRVTVARNGATGACYVSAIGGNFE